MACKPMEVEEISFLNKNLQRTQQYVEIFIVIWLDGTLETNNHISKTIEQLQTVSNDVEVFGDFAACIDFITSLKNEHVLFIISSSVDRCIITVAQDFPAISAVYILCSSETGNHERWSEPIRKFSGTFNNVNELIEQIKSDARRIEHELIRFEIVDASSLSFPFSRNLNKQECSFMYSQLLKDIFLKFQDNSTTELADYCRRVYADNSFQLAKIDEFERDYEEQKAIWWYTTDSFLYKMVNKALRIQHVETLYSMRTFIRHLHQQLMQLCPMNNKTQSMSVPTLYRGQRMPICEFEKLKKNKGGLLSVSSFLSTSTSRDMALIYAGESNDTKIAMIYEITFDLNHKTNSSFACIERFSEFGEAEHEWLFSMGAVFRIGEIELVNNIWHLSLMLTNDQDETLEKLSVHMSKIIQIERHNPLVPLCRLFTRMDQCKKAVELCEKNIETENGWEIKATLYDALAWMHADEEDEDLVLHCHQQALNIVVENVDANDPLLASYHSNVAISCSAAGQKKRAIDHYRMAISLEYSAPQPDYTNIAYSYDSMGDILHYTDKKYDEALCCYERALELMLVHLPSTHLDIFALYKSMVDIYDEQNEDDKALDMLNKCLDAEQKSPECTPHDLGLTYQRIVKIYKKQKKFKEAARMLNKYPELEAVCQPSIEPEWKNINPESVFARILPSDDTM